MSQRMRQIVDATVIATMASFLVVAAVGCSAAAPEVDQVESDPLSDGAENVRLVGHNDLQGRQSLQLTTRSDEANGNWAYVGHQPNDRPGDDEPQMNAITGEAEINGTSVLDITDPANPTLQWHIPGISRGNHRAVSVVYDYTHDESDRDYLVRSADTGEDFRFQIFDITDRATDPEAITLVSEITGTPPDSCGPGCGGPFIIRAHKGFWSEESGYYYTASGEPGFRNTLLHIWDLRDPTDPQFVSRAWLPGMKDTEDEASRQKNARATAGVWLRAYDRFKKSGRRDLARRALDRLAKVPGYAQVAKDKRRALAKTDAGGGPKKVPAAAERSFSREAPSKAKSKATKKK